METDKSQNKDTVEDLKNLVEKLKDENFQLREIIENLPGSIYWKNKDGIYQGRNKTSAESLRSMNFPWKIEHIVGKTDFDLFSEEMANTFRTHDLQVMQNRKESTQEEIAILDNGEKIIQLSTKRPLYNEKGEVVGVVGNTVDITYLKKIESELREAKEKAEQANVVKTEFIRNMEHDIRTPFSGVWGIANILVDKIHDKTNKELIQDMARCAKELLDYCNGILDFSKIDLGALPILEKKFDVKKLSDSIIAIEKPAAKLKNLQLILEYDENIPTVLVGDQYRLQRILLNLVSNAIKFTEKGHVKLMTKLIKQQDNKNIIVRFIVQDTGIGIPLDKQNFIYEKFTKLNPSHISPYKGLGLGLRIVKQFVEEMNGEIDLKSDQGCGSTFICSFMFKLPLVNDLLDDY